VEAVFEVEDVDVCVWVGCEGLDVSAGRRQGGSATRRSSEQRRPLNNAEPKARRGVKALQSGVAVPSLGQVLGLLILESRPDSNPIHSLANAVQAVPSQSSDLAQLADIVQTRVPALTHPSIIQQPYRILQIPTVRDPLRAFVGTAHVAREVGEEVQGVAGG
jgi:hypothetical protein